MSGRSPSTPPLEAILSSSLRVLIVEDVPADAELIILTLETANITCECTITDTLTGCQQFLETQPWDLLLSDYRLPGFTAYQVLEVLQQSGQSIPLILVTGSLGEEAAVDCIKAGMTDYVLKDRLFRLPMVLERSLREFALNRQQRLATAQIHQQAQREAIINRLAQAMRETLILDEVLQTTADLLQSTLQVSGCTILRPNQAGAMVIQQVSRASQGREAFLGKECRILNYYQNRAEPVDLIDIPDTGQLPPTDLRDMVAQYGIGAILSVSLQYQNDRLGSICLHQSHPHTWTADEKSLMQAIAAQCAIAIHQAQLFEQVQQQAEREQLLNQVSRTINSSLDANFILQEIVRLTGECFKVDRVVIYIVEAAQVRVSHEWLDNPHIPSMGDFTAPLTGFPATIDQETGDFSRQPFHVPDYAQLELTPARTTILHQYQTRSLLNVPILFQDEFFGGLDLYTTTCQRTFNQDEIGLLQRIADQAAIALYNAQSYERLEQTVRLRTRELEAEKLLSDAANRTKSEFLANMSHELRTPLTGVLGFSSVLLKQIFGPLNDKQKQYVENILSCGEHLLALINDLLDLSKIEAGREELILEEIDLQEFCDSCISLIREQADSQGLQLVLAIAPSLTTCIADRRRLKQILFNLLSNAVKFTEQGQVTLVIERQAAAYQPSDPLAPRENNDTLIPIPQPTAFIRFNVADTGIGIAETDIPLLFQPFQQLDGGLDRKYQGTGLGLTLARKLAHLHGGDIIVTSELGKGSCFSLKLPDRTSVDSPSTS